MTTNNTNTNTITIDTYTNALKGATTSAERASITRNLREREAKEVIEGLVAAMVALGMHVEKAEGPCRVAAFGASNYKVQRGGSRWQAKVGAYMETTGAHRIGYSARGSMLTLFVQVGMEVLRFPKAEKDGKGRVHHFNVAKAAKRVQEKLETLEVQAERNKRARVNADSRERFVRDARLLAGLPEGREYGTPSSVTLAPDPSPFSSKGVTLSVHVCMEHVTVEALAAIATYAKIVLSTGVAPGILPIDDNTQPSEPCTAARCE